MDGVTKGILARITLLIVFVFLISWRLDVSVWSG
jgi:hypothetical protein